MQLVRDGKQIQIEVVVTFLMIFGVHMNVLFVIKVKIFVLIKWSYRSSPPFMLIIKLNMISII
jgi:hypothetical protein